MSHSPDPYDDDDTERERLRAGQFDLDDFRRQIAQLRQFGSLRKLMRQVPGLEQAAAGLDLESELNHLQGIIDSMTPAERHDPHMIDSTRRRRIAQGAGVHPAEVSGLVKQFDAMAAMVRQLARGRRRAVVLPAAPRPPAERPPGAALQSALNRNLMLWEFIADT